MIASLVKVIKQSKSDRAGIIQNFMFRIVKHSKPGFLFLGQQGAFLNKIYQIEKEYLEEVRKESSKITPSQNHSTIRTCVPSDSRIIQALLDRRSRQVSLIQDGNHEIFCKTIHYESDEEYELDPTVKDIDLRDKDEQWRKVQTKRRFGGVIEFLKQGPEGNKIQDYLMNSEDRLAPCNTATLEYSPLTAYS